MKNVRAELAEGWGVLVASAAGFGLGLSGLPFYTMAVFVEPLGKAFRWSVAEIQGGLTIMLLANVATLPAAAWLAERFGPRLVGAVSVIGFSLSFMSLAGLSGDLIDYYLRWVVMSAAGAGTLAVVWTQVIGTWFTKGRGLALGLTMMGTGITALFGPLLADRLIAEVGWRGAYIALGGLPLLVSLPLVLFFFREKKGAVARAARETRGAAPQLMSHWRFWVISLAFLLVGASVAGVISNLVKVMRGHGFSARDAAGMASLTGLFVIFGRAGCGGLLDRFWAPAVAAVFFGMASAGCLLLRSPHLSATLLGASAAAVGLAAGAEFDVLPYLAGRYFGVAHVGLALGLLSMFFYVGAAIGPWGMGTLVDLNGGYDLPLLMAAVFFALGGGFLLVLGRYPREPDHSAP